MIRKYLIVSVVTLLPVIFTGVATAASSRQEAADFNYEEPAKYAANFDYTPSTQAVPGSAGVTFAIGGLTYNYQRDTAIRWYDSEQLANLPDAMKQDLFKLLTAKGVSVRGPFDSYDLIPYPDKKAIDLWLVPTFELFVTLKDKKMEHKSYWIQTGNVKGNGKITGYWTI